MTSIAWRPIDPVEPRRAMPRGRSVAWLAEDGDDIEVRDRRREQERVDAVEEAAVTRDQAPGFLGAGGALQHGLDEVAGLGRRADDQAEDRPGECRPPEGDEQHRS